MTDERSISTVDELELRLSTPSEADRTFARNLEGDILILGAGGKMGPSLAKLVKRSLTEAARTDRVIAVSRFTSPAARRDLEAWGIDVLSCDLLDPDQVAQLPACPNVLYLAGRKFGSVGRPDVTWAVNALAPALCAYQYRQSRIVMFSTGNVYGMREVTVGGSVETDEPAPVGEYAQSCLARERILEYHSRTYGTRCVILRLNYAVDLRYGVLVDIATKVLAGEAVDLSVPAFNTIWQRDANSYAFRALGLAESPVRILNVTGAETARVRDVALWFANRFNRECHFSTQEGKTALLSDASVCYSLLGRPSMSGTELMESVAGWISSGGEMLDKPTHFEVRDGRY
ncbi:MAG: NAD-dependent epimerase/dehydratase family protein [Acidobacteriaceae bacterium]|nr:NAD-dependent epimerase/dehydratase family protein [Acidobacteriaceae bacterium]